MIPASLLFTLAALPPAIFSRAPSGPWDAFNFAPDSKTVLPVAIFHVEGAVIDPDAILFPLGSTTLSGNGTWISLDFGKEVGGIMSITFDDVSDGAAISLSWSESPTFVSNTSSDTSVVPSPSGNTDGVLIVPTPISQGTWTQPSYSLRGGFRFFNIISNSDAPVTISFVSLAITFMPHFDDLRDYSGYFYAKDPVNGDPDFLTKLWYAGAYTVQTNTLAVDQGRSLQIPGWFNNATLGIASPVFVDGAKRDRTIWPGDMGIAVPTAFFSTKDLLPTKNSLATLFTLQDPVTSEFQYSGPAINALGSITYHAWTLVGVYNYYLYTGDISLVQNLWTNYTKGVAFLESNVDTTGLLNVIQQPDWGRNGGTGHGAPGNFLYYKVLTNSVILANALNQTTQADGWAQNATELKTNINTAFWDDAAGLYRDDADNTASIFPQDANSYAVVFNITNTHDQNTRISEGLLKNWQEFGPVSPELPDTIIPFIGGFEVQAHFIAGQAERALDLLRLEWGYILTTNLSVQSTLIEGLTANGSIGFRGQYGYNFDSSYVSHSHGWSTGPTSALTIHVVGLDVNTPQGQNWTFAPQPGNLPAAEGGFETGLGQFLASWIVTNTSFSASVTTPAGTFGNVRLPGNGTTFVNGEASVNADGTLVLAGGTHLLIRNAE